MKRILFAAVLLLGLSMLTTSCYEGNDENNYAKNIVGSWRSDRVEYFLDGKLVNTDIPNVDYLIVFTNDGYTYCTDEPNFKLPYVINGDVLQFGTMCKIIKLTKDKMELEESLLSLFDENSDKSITYYTKVK